MNKNLSKEIIDILRQEIPIRGCELTFSNTFELLCAVLLSAQTTDKRVNTITPELFSRYPNPKALMDAKYEDVYNIIVSLGLAKNKTRSLLSLAEAVHNKYNDVVPNTLEELMKLPGVGRKTAQVVLAVGFSIPAMPVDTHLHRMAIRLGYIKKDGTVIDAEKAYKRYIPEEEWIDAHHLFLLFGRYHCKSIGPKCSECKLIKYCKK